MHSETLNVAVAQPVIRVNDLKANVASHVDAIRVAESRLVIFPELSLTGYDLDAPVVDMNDPLLKDLVDVCAQEGSVALIGAPVGEGGHQSIATLRVDGTGVTVVYRKSWLHGDEFTRFTPGSGPSTIDVDGWVVGLAICRDTGQSRHTAQMAAHGVELYAAGVVDVAADVVECQARAFVISRALAAPVAIASFAGPTGGGFDETAGHSAIFAADGTMLAEADGRAGSMVRAELTRRPR